MRRFLSPACLLSLVAILLALVAPADAARRVALIIGNDDYQNLPVLKKAVADAETYAAVLSAKGFDQIIRKRNLTRAEMDEAIATFVEQIQPGDTALFAYSGHGWSDGSQNFIVGTDAPATGSGEFLARISIPLKNGNNGVIDDMDRRGATLKVAIIDACRNNPFSPPSGGRSIGLGRGLSRIDPPRGTFVIFSAGSGQAALDRLSDSDPHPNSVFTRVFTPLLEADLTLQEAVKATQQRVVELASTVNANQQPAYYDEVIGGACLSGTCTAALPEPKVVVEPKVVIDPPAVDPAKEAWTAIMDTKSIAVLKSFVAQFPDSVYAGFAEARIEELAAVIQPPPEPEPEPKPPPVAHVKPSWCPKAKLATEYTICDSAVLSALDFRLSDLYAQVRKRDPSIRPVQRQWLAGRDACGYDAGCIEQLYVQQIRYLEGWL